MKTSNTIVQEGREEFQRKERLEEEILQSLNLECWSHGPDLEKVYQELKIQIDEAVANESTATQHLRKEVFPRIEEKNAFLPRPSRGSFTPEMIAAAHTNILFNGGVEAVHGILTSHDSLPMSISQIGICLVSYNGKMGSYSHRLFKKELRERDEDPLEEVTNWLEKRLTVSGTGSQLNHGTGLARKGLRAYAERKILIESGEAAWRLGKGNLFPLELFTDYWAGSSELLDASLTLLRDMVSFQKVIYVPSQMNKLVYLTLGHALQPLEYLVLESVEDELKQLIQYRHQKPNSSISRFIEECGPEMVMVLCRASALAPARLVYAHKNHVDMAALITMADSMLHSHRGFPMLLDLGDSICKATFNPGSFRTLVAQGYAEAGHPFEYDTK